MRALLTGAALAGTLATTLAAQGSDMANMPGMAGMLHGEHVGSVATSALARRQIDSVVTALRALGTTRAASIAGFRPAFGWIPTMGVHWVRAGQLLNGRQTDRAQPSQLMFSPIAGRDSLVGIAYGYFASTADTIRPTLFDGAPPWHDHADLGPPGTTLVMLHVWFVPSPDGPFAGTNPNLPFWAVGLAAPDSARMRDAAFAAMVRRAALALGETVDSTSLLAQLERSPRVERAIAPHRDSIGALIIVLRDAERRRDRAGWERAARRVAAQWDAIEAIYVANARTPDGKQRVEEYIAMLLGEHHE
jgi:hypothetical protein